MTVETLTQIVDIALIVVFVLAIAFTLIAAIIGFKNGVFRTTHRMLVLIILFVIAACTLTPTMKLIEVIPLNWIPNFQSIVITNESTGVSFVAHVTTAKETLVKCLQGYYQLFGIAGNSARAAELAFAVAETILKLFTFFIDTLLIITLGGLFEIIMWHAAGKHFVPKMVRKTVKWPWVSMIQNSLVFLISSFMLLAPVSSIVNAISNSYNKNEHDANGEIMLYVDGFMKSYNNSLFAKTFVNWTVNDQGLSLDGQVMDFITKSTFENVEFSVIDTVSSMADIATIVIDDVAVGMDGSFVIDAGALASAEVIS